MRMAVKFETLDLGGAREEPLLLSMQRDAELIQAQVLVAADRARPLAVKVFREQTRARLGSNIAQAWRAEVRQVGFQANEGPVVRIWTRAPNIVDAFEAGAPIRAANGQYLAIPNDEARRLMGRNRVTPDDLRAKGFVLEVARLKNGELWLVGQNLTVRFRQRRGTFFGIASRRAQTTGAGVQSALLFKLTKIVKAPKLLSLETAADAGQKEFDTVLEQELKKDLVFR